MSRVHQKMNKTVNKTNKSRTLPPQLIGKATCDPVSIKMIDHIRSTNDFL